MNIIVMLSVRYELIGYDCAIDHNEHKVFYVGTEEKLLQIPAHLPCVKITISQKEGLFETVSEAILSTDCEMDLLLCGSERDLMDAARVRSRFDIKGPKPSQAAKVRDKTVMKTCVSLTDIQIPRFARLDKWLSGDRFMTDSNDGIILKPVDGASAADVIFFENEEVLLASIEGRTTGIFILDSAGPCDFTRYEVEEYIAGPVMHLDGLARKGSIEVIVASRYVNSPLDYAKGSSMGSVQLESLPLSTEKIKAILASVEIDNGAFHLEIILARSGPVFLEIAHRVGGARVTETFQRKTGLHLSVEDIRLLVDPEYRPRATWDLVRCYGWFVVPGHQLEKPYCRVTGYQSIVDSQMLEEINLLSPEKMVSKTVTYAEARLPLAGLLSSDRSDSMLETLQRLFDEVSVEGLESPCCQLDT